MSVVQLGSQVLNPPIQAQIVERFFLLKLTPEYRW